MFRYAFGSRHSPVGEYRGAGFGFTPDFHCALEGLFLIRQLGKSIYAEDVGLWNAFCPLKQIQEILKFKALRLLDEYQSSSGSTIPFVVS
ncbi:hypothetical protein WDW86_12515 [Bdellovibrionota bacterium FG-2]